MFTSVLVVCSDVDLFVAAQRAIGNALGADAAIKLLARAADEAKRELNSLAANPSQLLVIDARLPREGKGSPDQEGQFALELLSSLRREANNTPALVLTPRTMAMPQIDDYCTPDKRAIALPIKWLESQHVVKGFLGMLDKPATKTWDVIEIGVFPNLAKCYLGTRGGDTLEWGDAAIGQFYPVRGMAKKYSKYRVLDQCDGRPIVKQNWLRDLHQDGCSMFRCLVLQAIGTGLFSHLETAAGGLARLAFRFRIVDPSLHSAPFEATVRVTEQDDSIEDSPFLLVHAPIARHMGSIAIRSPSIVPGERVERPARILFIRSQLGDKDAPGMSDTLPVVVEDASGRKRVRHYAFGRLDNIDLELKAILELAKDPRILEPPAILDLEELGDISADQAERQKLANDRFDIVHFAGHSLTIGGKTLLVLPSGTAGEALAMTVDDFSSRAAQVGARLVYLSSCQGSSAQTVVRMAQEGIPHVLGFRWDVEDQAAAQFARLFYDALLRQGLPIVAAFSAACGASYRQLEEKDQSPIWASPILVAQGENWVGQRLI